MNLKENATTFLKLVIAGKIDEAYEKYVDMKGTHHNVYFPPGFGNLRDAMKDNEAKFPKKKLQVKNTIQEGNLVAVHSHLQMGEIEMTVVHMFRFNPKGKICEMWDVGQQILKDSPNTKGAF